MNINKQNVNNNDYLAKLEEFFIKKINEDKKIRKIKQREKENEKEKEKKNEKEKEKERRNEKRNEKKKKNILVFEFDTKQFRLVNKNGVAPLSVARISKKNSLEQEDKNNTIIEKNKRQILKTKYELLFEYQDIENYTNIYKDRIGPLEETNKKANTIIDEIRGKENLQTETFTSSRDNIKMEIDAYKELLHNTEGQNKEDRLEMITGYLEKQSELYTLSKEYYINRNEINETNTKLK